MSVRYRRNDPHPNQTRKSKITKMTKLTKSALAARSWCVSGQGPDPLADFGLTDAANSV